MKNNSIRLTNAISLAESRYDLLRENYLQAMPDSHSFFTESFARSGYKDTVLNLLPHLHQIFVHRYTDWRNNPLIDDSQLVLTLDDDITVANAWVIQTDKDNIEITLTLGLVIILDILCASRWIHISEIFPNKSLPTPPFEDVCSDTLSTIMNKNLPHGISVTAQIRLADFFSTNDEEKRKDWTTLTTLSILWVLSHEVGHFLCGHVGYNKEQNGVIGISEILSQKVLNMGQQTSASGSYEKIWARELMADIYATIRIFLIVVEEVKEKNWPESISNILSAVTTASTFPGLVFLLSSDNKERSQDILQTAYPSEWCRIFNVFATITFLVLPLQNTAIDPRKNPLEQFWEENSKLAIGDWRIFLISMIESFEGIKSYLRDMNFIDSHPSSEVNLWAHFSGSLMGARTGLVILNEEESELRLHLFQWMYAMKRLCTQLNFEFSHYLSRSWMTGKVTEDISEYLIKENMIREDIKERMGENIHGLVKNIMSMNLTNDPAYKILDDWMSNIYRCWQSDETEILSLEEECIMLGEHVVQIMQRL